MKKKILIFISQPIDERNIKRLGYDELKDDFDYKLIDISLLFNRRIKKFQKVHNYDQKNFILTSSITQLLKSCELTKSKFYFLDLTTYKTLLFSIFQVFLTFYGGTKIEITGLNLPKNIFQSKSKRFKNFIKNFNIFALAQATIKFFYYKICIFILPLPKIVFSAGKKDPKKKINCTIIKNHSLDYDKYISNAKFSFKTDEKYILYIDQMMFYHPENEINNVSNICNKKKTFFEELNFFFDNILKNFNTNIYILLHPRRNSDYIKFLKEKFFDSRIKIIEEDNYKYFKNCEFVICHTSSAFQFAILNYKPIVFSYSNCFDEYTKHYCIALSNEVGCSAVNLVDNFSEIKFDVDNDAYAKYVENYITENKYYKMSFWKNVNKELLLQLKK